MDQPSEEAPVELRAWKMRNSLSGCCPREEGLSPKQNSSCQSQGNVNTAEGRGRGGGRRAHRKKSLALYLHPLLVPPKNAFQLRPCARNSTSAPPWGLKLWCPGQGCTALSSLIRLQVTPHLWASVYKLDLFLFSWIPFFPGTYCFHLRFLQLPFPLPFPSSPCGLCVCASLFCAVLCWRLFLRHW